MGVGVLQVFQILTFVEPWLDFNAKHYLLKKSYMYQHTYSQHTYVTVIKYVD